ncbi:MAG: type II secretion system F family protein [Candidatus Omnitrophica bacterium]|nr:type II secretion system F family protein [Candidatus Omnitrophota bacterium]MBU4488001.1 type II secretion system F family protein [Candidatus Omnitrophota bacterium]MCG2704756.1 type II secretion system F family protein [Candidatus Omnitrophota bacterium]
MALYKYVAKNTSGQTVTGVLDAPDRALLIGKLREKDLVIVSIAEAKTSITQQGGFFQRRSVNIDDMVIFSRQLATMVDAGIPLVGALDILGEQMENKTFSEVILNVRDNVETGSSLSEALSKYPKTFSTLFVNMVKAGESSGMLDEILDRVATYLEKTSILQRKIKSALIYPAVITFMAIVITIILLVKVIPVFKDIFAGFGAALPRPTQVLIDLSDFLRKYFFFGVGFLVIMIFLLIRYINTEKGRLRFDTITLTMPIFGILLRKVAVSKFTRTLSTLVKSGVPILSSLEIVGKTSGNKLIEKAVVSIRSSIREGENIAEPLAKSKVFPPMVVRMISVGEQTGELEKMLSKIADFYDAQVDAAVTGLTSMIEPLIIAFLGIVIGTIVICMFLPIFKISTIINM